MCVDLYVCVCMGVIQVPPESRRRCWLPLELQVVTGDCELPHNRC